jgi:hypothetical protein
VRLCAHLRRASKAAASRARRRAQRRQERAAERSRRLAWRSAAAARLTRRTTARERRARAARRRDPRRQPRQLRHARRRGPLHAAAGGRRTREGRQATLHRAGGGVPACALRSGDQRPAPRAAPRGMRGAAPAQVCARGSEAQPGQACLAPRPRQPAQCVPLQHAGARRASGRVRRACGSRGEC